MIQYHKVLSILLIAIVILSSCKHEDINLSEYPDICFEKQILPIFQNNCTSCHNANGEAGYNLSYYEGIMQGVSAGKPFDSEIYKVLSDKWEHMMPPENPLTKDNRTLIRLWIEQGALKDCSDSLDIVLISQNGETKAHYTGENCMACHSSNGGAPGYFSAAGTVFDSTKTNPYSNARVKLYTEILAGGNLVSTIDADEEGYFYTTDNIDFSAGLYPVVEGTNGETMFMGQPTFSGQCYSCHGISQENIYIAETIIPIPNDSICFENQVLPILLSSCALSNCHDPITAEEDFIFTSYWNVMNSEEEDLVVPGNPNESKIYKVITDDDPEDRMPPGPGYQALSQNQIDIIYNWIAEGALENINCNTQDCDTVNVNFSGTIWPIVETNCKGCHSGNNANAGIHLENYNDLKTIVDNNKLIDVIYAQNGLPQMPPTFALSECNKTQIEMWIENGAPND
jgi:mono/diheme cytochrome c family protein